MNLLKLKKDNIKKKQIILKNKWINLIKYMHPEYRRYNLKLNNWKMIKIILNKNMKNMNKNMKK